ncbi:MAG: hypothetical protein HYU66_28425 [Armatimonadetes bacterium]|nr:hypothetical protein [Armatimonadota bacterium]
MRSVSARTIARWYDAARSARRDSSSFADSPRTDDGDFFVTNLPAATVTASAVYADPDDGAISRPWGPVSFAVVVGQVVSVAPLVPPGG